jgi:hypothetical protein
VHLGALLPPPVSCELIEGEAEATGIAALPLALDTLNSGEAARPLTGYDIEVGHDPQVESRLNGSAFRAIRANDGPAVAWWVA